MEFLAGNRIRGLDSEKMQVVAFNPVTGYGTAVLNDGGAVSGYNTYTYLTSGTSNIVTNVSANVEVLLVGAGGRGDGGGDGKDKGGGGGGGAVMVSNVFTLPAGTHSLSVGTTNGNSSTFYGITCTGGNTANGKGATRPSSAGTGTSPTFPAGITGTVYAGYTGGAESSGEAGGGGAGSNQNGSQGSGQQGGDAGNGIQLTGFESVSYYYGAGGGGSGRAGQGGDGGLGGGGAGSYNSGGSGAGGTGGRNNGYTSNQNAGGGDGGANTGSGGGGGQNGGGSGNANTSGGSGIVVIKISSQNSVPLDVQDGSIFYTTDTNKAYVLNSGTWTEL